MINGFMHSVAVVCRMIKIEHSVFALPFAYTGAFLAAEGWPGWSSFLLLTLAMVAVRSFAMAFNRLADLSIDRVNPRTQDRPLVSGELSVNFTIGFLVATGAIFVLACWGMNTLCLVLSPLALILSAFYSFTKRFTWGCHFVLGSVLGLAPVAGWLCVDPVLTLAAALFFFGVAFWVAGFDILYSCQDAELDKNLGLHSLPAHLGLKGALTISLLSHINAALFFLLAGWAAGLGGWYFLIAGLVGLVLLWEHRLVSPDDLSRVNVAFFTMNGIIAVFIFLAVLLDMA